LLAALAATCAIVSGGELSVGIAAGDILLRRLSLRCLECILGNAHDLAGQRRDPAGLRLGRREQLSTREWQLDDLCPALLLRLSPRVLAPLLDASELTLDGRRRRQRRDPLLAQDLQCGIDRQPRIRFPRGLYGLPARDRHLRLPGRACIDQRLEAFLAIARNPPQCPAPSIPRQRLRDRFIQ